MHKYVSVLFLASLFSTPVAAQVYPVLHDANDLPIGNVISIESTPLGHRFVQMVSRQGFVAGMRFTRNPNSAGFLDRAGLIAVALFPSSDCTGDPIMLPRSMVALHGQLEISNDTDLRLINMDYSRFKDGDLRNYHWGDLMEWGDNVYYAPLDASESTEFVESYRLIAGVGCNQMDRCDELARKWHPHILVFEDTGLPMEEWCPDIQDPVQPHFQVTGFRLSELLLNDHAVTGFESTAFEYPLSIKYVDIETVLKEGFENVAE